MAQVFDNTSGECHQPTAINRLPTYRMAIFKTADELVLMDFQYQLTESLGMVETLYSMPSVMASSMSNMPAKVRSIFSIPPTTPYT